MLKSNGLLTGQTAVVTGANSGIGEGIARAMAQAGANVIVNYVSGEASALALVKELEAGGGRAAAVFADVADEAQVAALFKKAVQLYGGVQILVNNAGIQKDAAFTEMTLAAWQKVLDVNLTGQFLCAREAARLFIKSRVNPALSCAAGKIICISSVHEVIPWSGHCNYAASKGGVMLLMKTMAQELAPLKIRVNSIAPGAIKTPINQTVWSDPAGAAKMLDLIPYKRIGETADIGKAAVWLASDESDYINGATIFVDGAMTCYPGFATGG
ncbi:MAG: sugar dehydrogenase [Elusimicrobia bacterium CG1_02_56_21]|nr:MAG: sugar dehydrogenase [Elusimicrobia bacterium CG1_02_56_21]